MSALPRLYADNDVAGMVYGPGDDPDALLAGFVRTLLGEGWDVLGILQRSVPGATSRNRAVAFDLVPAGEWPEPPVAGVRAPGRAADALPELGRRLAAVLHRRPDLVVLNRFGRAEVAGGGLVDVLGRALEGGVPVLVAVPAGLYDTWIAGTGGLAVTIEPRAERLRGWWAALGNAPSPRRAPPACPHEP
ncbi:DUF2478 domain-containing protein [Oharaeibacter diazotrophicus]|uniref:Uncharacterized protein DUF2478 n=2 Tax=Oharaeibacter diazotrophicus TaxID=1920512 RepID=A0A4R6RL66_9HYPH|nr:DUF2478 domain-containing protein [Oharaeibacter diazotrophicus]TDP87389.1 uncharacterized protein DUF2478 [Oharaeibacter diazotrophicus]BBE70668.1 hypothetical protein OHA_1_00232 [Pleomorphomonas sp. SM30]GLS77414.1 hypothetical protein GCM10007904_27510 [Oharaeibacter diazotrophicus]